jgi:hypothetical protein
MHGDIRKTSNHQKTIEMIKALDSLQNTPADDVQTLILDGFLAMNFPKQNVI